ncbi:uncharacterized protein VP01_94g10 [Puccinia sorghi]|uniref:IMD domain-containing protein n=1 Tax=Puccinia sorghi TaxID=27349 RepID=A0A0L6U6H0_9BASI|nr:uncharacterized protein VP01_94g10 [Puccinia sorghi]
MSSQYSVHQQSFLKKADLKDSLGTLAHLLAAANTYQQELLALSNATAAFANALEDCARLKGTQANHQHQDHLHHDHLPSLNPAEKLLAASGLHFITANLQQVLLAHQQSKYEALLSTKTKAIRETELRNMTQGGSRHSRNMPRDLDSFRRGLRELQDQVEQVESLKHAYYLQVADGEQQVWNKVADSISLVVKSEVEVYDRIASKPISDPTLEAMISSIPDPFDAYKPAGSMDTRSIGGTPEIYSILDPLSNPLLGSPHRTRRSVDLNESLASLGPVRESSCSPSSHSLPPSLPDVHPHLNATSHWAESVVQRNLITSSSSPLPVHASEPAASTACPPDEVALPVSTRSVSHLETEQLPKALRNVCSLLSTDSSLTATLSNPAHSSPSPHIVSPSSSAENPDTTILPQHPPLHPPPSAIVLPPPAASLIPPIQCPPINRLSTATSLQPRVDEVESLLREQPPNGLDLSDSDL